MNAPQHAHPTPVIAPRPMPAEMVDALRALWRSLLDRDGGARAARPRRIAPFDFRRPAVVYCESNQDVIDAVRLPTASAVPVIPYEGHLLGCRAG